MSRATKAQLIAVLVPFVGVFAGILLFHDTTLTALGFPMIFFWLFLWMPLTSIVLHIAWKIEQPVYDDLDEQLDPVESTGGH